jgi:hypothetical protein
MANPTKSEHSHGQSGNSPANPVPEHQTWGGRDEVAGGPEGRGNGEGDKGDAGTTWSRGVEAHGTDEQPVTKPKDDEDNAFSGDPDSNA